MPGLLLLSLFLSGEETEEGTRHCWLHLATVDGHTQVLGQARGLRTVVKLETRERGEREREREREREM